jgi:HD superfamily phosphodiesterase
MRFNGMHNSRITVGWKVGESALQDRPRFLRRISHFRRVWSTAQQLVGESGADELVILTACYFHDLIT